MDISTYDKIKAQTEADIASGVSQFTVGRNAELLCGKLKFEFHPLICDIVEAAFTFNGEPPAKCKHVPAAARRAADADLASATAGAAKD
jgi:hypothetical protein